MTWRGEAHKVACACVMMRRQDIVKVTESSRPQIVGYRGKSVGCVNGFTLCDSDIVCEIDDEVQHSSIIYGGALTAESLELLNCYIPCSVLEYVVNTVNSLMSSIHYSSLTAYIASPHLLVWTLEEVQMNVRHTCRQI